MLYFPSSCCAGPASQLVPLWLMTGILVLHPHLHHSTLFFCLSSLDWLRYYSQCWDGCSGVCRLVDQNIKQASCAYFQLITTKAYKICKVANHAKLTGAPLPQRKKGMRNEKEFPFLLGKGFFFSCSVWWLWLPEADPKRHYRIAGTLTGVIINCTLKKKKFESDIKFHVLDCSTTIIH